MPKKGTFIGDTFETLSDFGKSTGKAVGNAVKDTLNPLNAIDQITGTKTNDRGMEQLEKGKSKKPNHTPLDFDKLGKKFSDNDKAKTDALRQRLHQLVKNADEKLLLEHKQEEQQKKQQEIMQEEQKKRHLQQQKYQQSADIPQGKQRRSIFSPKKVAKREQAEIRPSSGKQ